MSPWTREGMRGARGWCVVALSLALPLCSRAPEPEVPVPGPGMTNPRVPGGNGGGGTTGGSNTADTVSGTVANVTRPLQGQYTPGGSDPISIPNFQGYQISCIAAVNMAREDEAKNVCPSTCAAYVQSVWTGYWRASVQTRTGVCECMLVAGGSVPPPSGTNPVPPQAIGGNRSGIFFPAGRGLFGGRGPGSGRGGGAGGLRSEAGGDAGPRAVSSSEGGRASASAKSGNREASARND
jgi:hypothetical protein